MAECRRCGRSGRDRGGHHPPPALRRLVPPEGKLAAGEREVDGAIREVLEETGYHVRLGRSLGETRYLKVDSGVARQKLVRWWAMEAASGGFGPTREVDELKWLTLGEAHDALTRDQDRDVLDRFVRGSAMGRMVLLVRNGSAVSRSAWQDDDRLRPLDTCGWAQADELVRLLAHFDPTDIRAADVTRCQQTVQPLASSLGLPVVDEPLLPRTASPMRRRQRRRWSARWAICTPASCCPARAT